MKKVVNDYEWSTHGPLLKTIIEVLNPKLIVELGTGLYSSPIFLSSSAEKLFFIDNDQEWLNHVKENNNFDSRCVSIFHDLGEDIKIYTFLRELPQEEKNKIINYYTDLSATIEKESSTPKMLFVDHFTCARTLAINTLFDKFDIIGFHDCQPDGIKFYEYYFNENLHKNYNLFFLTSLTSWTGCFIKKSFNIESTLKTNIIPFVKDYCKENNLDSGTMNLING